MSGEREIAIRESTSTVPRVKTPPKSSAISVPFVYHPSDDGTDENLLILLHGLGMCRHFLVARMLMLEQAIPRFLLVSWGISYTYHRRLLWHYELPKSAYSIDLVEGRCPSPCTYAGFHTCTKKRISGFPPSTTSGSFWNIRTPRPRWNS